MHSQITKYIQLHGVPDSNSRDNAVPDLLSHSTGWIQCREETESDCPNDPAEEDAFTIATKPVYNQTGAGVA